MTFEWRASPSNTSCRRLPCSPIPHTWIGNMRTSMTSHRAWSPSSAAETLSFTASSPFAPMKTIFTHAWQQEFRAASQSPDSRIRSRRGTSSRRQLRLHERLLSERGLRVARQRRHSPLERDGREACECAAVDRLRSCGILARYRLYNAFDPPVGPYQNQAYGIAAIRPLTAAFTACYRF